MSSNLMYNNFFKIARVKRFVMYFLKISIENCMAGRILLKYVYVFNNFKQTFIGELNIL